MGVLVNLPSTLSVGGVHARLNAALNLIALSLMPYALFARNSASPYGPNQIFSPSGNGISLSHGSRTSAASNILKPSLGDRVNIAAVPVPYADYLRLPRAGIKSSHRIFRKYNIVLGHGHYDNWGHVMHGLGTPRLGIQVIDLEHNNKG